MNGRPLALTVDLDDTLWDGGPVIARAEELLDQWLCEHAPDCARQFPVDVMRELRKTVVADNPGLAHDLTASRVATIRKALDLSGHDPALATAAFEAFFAARNTVELFPGTLTALQRLASLVPLATLTNGNADVDAIGVGHFFRARVSPTTAGTSKPGAAIYHAACSALGIEPGMVLHVGDHPEMDIAGARRAGLRTAWMNRDGAPWIIREATPDFECRDLGELADWLEALS